jgi:hypothetical protein
MIGLLVAIAKRVLGNGPERRSITTHEDAPRHADVPRRALWYGRVARRRAKHESLGRCIPSDNGLKSTCILKRNVAAWSEGRACATHLPFLTGKYESPRAP